MGVQKALLKRQVKVFVPVSPVGEALLTVLSIRNPTQAGFDRLLMPIKPPEIEDDE